MTDTTVDLDAARAFLDLLGTRHTFQTFDDVEGRKASGLVRQFHGTLAQHAPVLTDLNERGAGVYVTVNGTNGTGRKAVDVRQVRAWFLDIDRPELPEFQLLPSVIVSRNDGKRHHAYWIARDGTLAEFTPIQKLLITKHQGDPVVHDLPRVMRIPGFLHNKDPKNPLVYEVQHLSDRTFTEFEMRDWLDDDNSGVVESKPTPPTDDAGRGTQERQPARATKAPKGVQDSGLPSGETILAHALKQRDKGRNNAGMWLACQLRDNSFTKTDALSVILDYVRCCPQSGHSYTEQEARHALKQAFSRPARDGWKKTGSVPVTPASAVELGGSTAALVDDLPQASEHPVTMQGKIANDFGIELDTTRYSLSAKGVYGVVYKDGAYSVDSKKVIAARAIWPDRKGVDQDGVQWVKINWHDSKNNVVSQWVRREVLASRDALRDLARFDAPVSLGRLPALSDYLTDTVAKVLRPDESVVSKPGWVDHTWRWPGLQTEPEYIGVCMERSNDLELWATGLDSLLAEDCKAALFALGLAAGAPLVRHMPQRCPILGLAGDSSTGKTTALRYALSVWSHPDTISIPSGSTSKGAQDQGIRFPDCPIFLDDLQQMEEADRIAFNNLIYFIGNGQRRVTSSKSQEAQGGERRFGVAFYASERSLLMGANSGVVLRIIERSGKTLAVSTQAEVLKKATAAAGAPALALGKIFNERFDALVAQTQARAEWYQQTYELRGDDRYTLAIAEIGLNLLCEITKTDFAAGTAITGAVAKDLPEYRASGAPREVLALEALMEKIGSYGWEPKTQTVYVGEEIVARKLDNGQVRINTRANVCAYLLTSFGGETRLLSAWAERGLIQKQGKHLKWMDKSRGRIWIQLPKERDSELLPLEVEADETHNGGSEDR